MTQADLLRYGWTAMFVIGTVGASLLVVLFVSDRFSPWVRHDPVLRTQADSTISDGVLIWLCAVFGLAAAVAGWFTLQIIALWSLLVFGFIFNLLILNMLRGRRAVTRSMRLTIDQLEDQRAKVKAAKA